MLLIFLKIIIEVTTIFTKYIINKILQLYYVFENAIQFGKINTKFQS